MSVYEFEAHGLDGRERPLSAFRGQALLIVNVASRCGFTPQYAGLEALQRDYGARGFSVLGFPCNQFGAQEPGDADEIQSFCEVNYGVSFPLFAKIDVKGPAAHPLYGYLTRAKPGLLGSRGVKWNFTKFLVDREGRPVARYGSSSPPEALKPAIEALL